MSQSAGLGVGALLRSRREELGQDTDSVSRQLRIRAIYIRAIEEGRIQDLPGTAYAVGFVRTYADFLGFDGNSVVASFRDELGQRGRPETVSWQIEDKDGGFPFGKLLIVLVVIAAAAYGLWYYLANTQSGTGLIEAVPEYLKKSTGTDKAATPAAGAAPADQSSGSTADTASAAAPAGSTAPATAGETTANQSATGQASTVGNATETPTTANNASEPSGSVAPAAPASAGTQPMTGTATAEQTATATATQGTTATSMAGQQSTGQASTGQTVTGQATAGQGTTGQVANAPTQPATGQSTAAQSGDAAPGVAAAATSSTTRISVRAKLESWVQINDKDGKPVLSRVLRAGETYAVPDEKGLVMNTGNAGGIEVVVDGKALPSLGSVGLVKRNIILDPDKLATGSVQVKTPGAKEPSTDGSGGTAPTGD